MAAPLLKNGSPAKCQAPLMPRPGWKTAGTVQNKRSKALKIWKGKLETSWWVWGGLRVPLLWVSILLHSLFQEGLGAVLYAVPFRKEDRKCTCDTHKKHISRILVSNQKQIKYSGVRATLQSTTAGTASFCHVGARSSHVSNAQNSELQSSGVQITNSLHTLGFGPSRPTLSQSTISHRYTQNKVQDLWWGWWQEGSSSPSRLTHLTLYASELNHMRATLSLITCLLAWHLLGPWAFHPWPQLLPSFQAFQAFQAFPCPVVPCRACQAFLASSDSLLASVACLASPVPFLLHLALLVLPIPAMLAKNPSLAFLAVQAQFPYLAFQVTLVHQLPWLACLVS